MADSSFIITTIRILNNILFTIYFRVLHFPFTMRLFRFSVQLPSNCSPPNSRPAMCVAGVFSTSLAFYPAHSCKPRTVACPLEAWLLILHAPTV